MRYADLENIVDEDRKARTETFKYMARRFREAKVSKKIRQHTCQILDANLILCMRYKDTEDFWERTSAMFTNHVPEFLGKVDNEA